MQPARVKHELSTGTLVKVGCFIVGGWLLIRLWPILLILLSALILVGTLNPLVAVLERRRISRSLSVAIIFAVLAVLTLLIGLITLPALGPQVLRLIEDAPAIQSRVAAVLEQHRITTALGRSIRAFQVRTILSATPVETLVWSKRAVEIVGYGVTIVVLAIYIMADRNRARGVLYAWVPREYHVRLARILINLETIVGGYMRGQAITSAAIAAFVLALLSICRVPNALAIAVFAGLTDVIPFVGGLLATMPAVLASLSRGLGISGIVLVSLLCYQELESRILVPRIYGRVLRLSSAAVVIALLMGGKLLGIVGALLALPIAAGIRMIIEELRVELPGDDTDDSDLRARDEHAERVYAARSAGATPEAAAAVAVEVADETSQADVPDPAEAVASRERRR